MYIYFITIMMEKSYKENRSAFARQIWTIRNERNMQINWVNNLLISDELKEECKSQIMRNFYDKMNKVSELSWYQESRESHLKDVQERINLIKRKNLKLNLYWNSSAVLEDMKKNYIDIEENQEMLGKKWCVVHIDIPAVWDFKWFKFDFFISEDRITPKEFELNPEYEKNSCSFQDSKKILEAIAGYMREYWVENIYWFKGKNSKWSYDYWVDDYFEFRSYYSFLRSYFKNFIWLNLNVWVSDTCLYHGKRCRYRWDFSCRDWDFTTYACDDPNSSTKGWLYLNWTNK